MFFFVDLTHSLGLACSFSFCFLILFSFFCAVDDVLRANAKNAFFYFCYGMFFQKSMLFLHCNIADLRTPLHQPPVNKTDSRLYYENKNNLNKNI